MSKLTLTRGLSPAVCAVILSVAFGAAASAQEFKAGQIVVTQPWTRATPSGASVAGGYLTITNNGTEPDRLVGGSTPAAAKAELHEMKMDGGVMRMRPLPNGLEIKPGQTVRLEPSGNHIMFEEIKQPFRQGDTVKGELRFEKAGNLDVDFKVEAIGAARPSSGGHQH